jgi:hypothetical protein
MSRQLGVLLLLTFFFTAKGHAAIVTVQFAGHMGGNTLGYTPGAALTGCFTYDTTATNNIQSASRTIFAVTIPQHDFVLTREIYGFGVLDNWTAFPIDNAVYDGYRVSFAYPGGYGDLSLETLDTTLLSGKTLPQTLPSLEIFTNHSIYFAVEEVQPYRSGIATVEHLITLPAVADQPTISIQTTGSEIILQIGGDPTSNYRIETSESLTNPNWTLHKEVAGVDATHRLTPAASSTQQYFRITQIPCLCL